METEQRRVFALIFALYKTTGRVAVLCFRSLPVSDNFGTLDSTPPEVIEAPQLSWKTRISSERRMQSCVRISAVYSAVIQAVSENRPSVLLIDATELQRFNF